MKTAEQRRDESRMRMAEYRKTSEYQEWLIKSREMRRANKEKYRRAAGVPTRHEIAERAQQRAQQAERRRLAKADFLQNFIGPPKPRKAMTDAEHYQWRICNEPDFYARELDRAQRYKARTRPGYRDSIVRWSDMPKPIKEVKHLQYLIARQIERNEQHENHQ